MVGGGAQVVLFTPVLGTPTGNPIAPVLKITATRGQPRTMADIPTSMSAGILTHAESFESAAARVFRGDVRGWHRPGWPRPSASAIGEFAIHSPQPYNLTKITTRGWG
jgi:hypothetical protein